MRHSKERKQQRLAFCYSTRAASTNLDSAKAERAAAENFMSRKGWLLKVMRPVEGGFRTADVVAGGLDEERREQE